VRGGAVARAVACVQTRRAWCACASGRMPTWHGMPEFASDIKNKSACKEGGMRGVRCRGAAGRVRAARASGVRTVMRVCRVLSPLCYVHAHETL